MKIALDIRCRKCYKVFQAELPYSSIIGYARGVVRCPYCNTLYHIRVNASITMIDITKEDLDGFEEWLKTERKLISAHQYRKQVEKYIETGELPNKMTALNHFQEYMKKKKHREFPIF